MTTTTTTGWRPVLTAVVSIILCVSARESTAYPEPPPVGNSYRKWNESSEAMTYSCIETYTLVSSEQNYFPGNGSYVRTWNSTTGKFNEDPPVCMLNCGSPRDETGTRVNYTTSNSLDTASYQCNADYETETQTPNITCNEELGMWSQSTLHCCANKTYPVSNTTRLLPPSDSNNDPENAIDSSLDTYVTLTDNMKWLVNLSSDGSWVEVMRVTLTLRLSTQETPYPCLLTSSGVENSRNISDSSYKKPCQAWDLCNNCSNTTNYFPVDNGLTAAANFCDNLRRRDSNWCDLVPWGLTPTDRRDNCSLPDCVNINLRTPYINQKGAPTSNTCAARYYIVDAYNSTEMKVNCERPNDRPSFGHALEIEVDILPPNVSLHLMHVEVCGRDYTGGCGRPLGYWGLETVNRSEDSIRYTEVTYRCRDDWHHMGGPLVSSCLEHRQWTEPDLSQCTDLPNLAEDAKQNDSGSAGIQSTGDGCYLMSSTCTLTLLLNRSVEVAAVVFTLTNSTNINVTTNVDVLRLSREWVCKKVLDPRPTAHFSCPQRPFGDKVRIRFSPPGAVVDGVDITVCNFTVCNIKVFGRDSVSAVECLQTDKGYDYKGHLNITVSGRSCHAWNELSPEKHNYTSPSYFPDISLDSVGNNCRNPNRSREKPWCFTTDPSVEWEYCPLLPCDDICRLREDGATYTGDIAFTKTGNSCVSQLRWTDQSSRQRFMRHHYYRQPGYAKCRNPIASQAAPWCYTNNGQPELCDIPTCPLVGDLKMVFLGPVVTEASLAEYIVPWKQKVRECFQWSQNSFPNPPDRFDYLTGPFQISKPCSGYHSPLGVLCDLVGDNSTRWMYFWFNCSAPESHPVCECTCDNKSKPVGHPQEFKDDLLVDTSTLSATVRKKTCARDDRPSAITAGTFGVVFLVSTIVVLSAGDIITIVRCLSRYLRRVAKKSRKPSGNR
ncbi:uncharacterized protein LOC112553253 isoform X2 [Pomacea canaliculata]|nr:uncharacterized protein LOC112553253 isoform X2 [Pomacea canaliculata]